MKPSSPLVALALLATSLVAVPGDAAAEAAPEEPPGRRDPDLAFKLSAIGAAASVTLLAGGIALNRADHDIASGIGSGAALIGGIGVVVAPSMGHAYADHPLTWGLPIRLAGGAVMLVGSATEGAALFGCRTGEPHECDTAPATKLYVAGGAIILAGILYDVLTVRSATERRNVRRGFVQVTPTLTPSSQGAVAGVGLSGAF